MKKKYFITSILILLFFSILMNAVLFFNFINIYRQYKKFQIDPATSMLYHLSNKKIAKKRERIKRIVLFGDSRIYQWNPSPVIEGFEFINRGVPGETSAQSLLRITNDVIQLKPDIVIIQIGGNDFNSIAIFPEMEDYIMINYEKNINSIIKELQKNNIMTIILSIFPFGPVDLYRLPLWTDNIRGTISIANKNLQKQNSPDILFIDCDKIFLDGNKMKKTYSQDMLHITPEGYIKLNDLVTQNLVK